MSAAVAAVVSAASTGALEVPLSLGAAPVGLALLRLQPLEWGRLSWARLMASWAVAASDTAHR